MDRESTTAYRLKLAEGFLAEAEQDFALRRWRSCADNAQLAAENAAKAVLAAFGPVGRAHDLAPAIQALAEGGMAAGLGDLLLELADVVATLGKDVHIRSDYGDEEAGLTPWDIFDEDSAAELLHGAKRAVHLAREIVRGRISSASGAGISGGPDD